ncbi:hypothetical protein G6M26_20505 [Agrobacterium tumefaciens]|nr:hypothetical protein [Agrobacterium tumefaciens]NTE20921.1 hypothetical protein [Agrobacterium tumefaciens]
MNKVTNLIAGFAGAVALNILHESLKNKSSNVPRVDRLGEEALGHALDFFGIGGKRGEALYAPTLAGDLISNTIYYSLIGNGNVKNVFSRGIVSGLAAGLGAVTLPKPMGLNPAPVAKNNQVKVLTVAYYLVGALVTATVVKAFRK